MSNYVGIVYGPNDSPLYCYSDGHNWHVINGQWSFGKKSKRINKKLEWRIVLQDMKWYEDYNEACVIIEKADKNDR